MIALLWIAILAGLALGLYAEIWKIWIVGPVAAILATGNVVILAQSGQSLRALSICWLGSLTAVELAYLFSSASVLVLLPPADISKRKC
jgi:hypothetical protein